MYLLNVPFFIIQLNLKNDSCELEIFMLHFTDDVLEHIVSEINRTFEPSILKMNQLDHDAESNEMKF